MTVSTGWSAMPTSPWDSQEEVFGCGGGNCTVPMRIWTSTADSAGGEAPGLHKPSTTSGPGLYQLARQAPGGRRFESSRAHHVPLSASWASSRQAGFCRPDSSGGESGETYRAPQPRPSAALIPICTSMTLTTPSPFQSLTAAAVPSASFSTICTSVTLMLPFCWRSHGLKAACVIGTITVPTVNVALRNPAP
jgi:hypothetical protein